MANEYPIPAKRPKYDTNRGTLVGVGRTNRESAHKRPGKSDDIWGDDFAEEDIEEMDFVATQACLQENSVLTQTNGEQKVSFIRRFNSMPSTSRTVSNINNINNVVPSPSAYSSQCSTQRRQVDNSKDTSNVFSIDYKDFEGKLMDRKVYNSTFKLEDNVVSGGSEVLKELEKLKSENKQLLNNFITKEGEAVFLRNQLQQTQMRAENDRAEKTRFIEEQESRHRTEINVICKEKEHLKTQLELQTFEVGNLMERCKLLESRSVRLTEPRSISLNSSVNRTKLGSPMRRSSISNSKPVKVKETCVQANIHNKSNYFLKTWSPYYPLGNIPRVIYNTPQPEKSVVDIQAAEKTGRRNLPILQEEDTFRIFENPELVKPVTIDGKRLTVEFVLPELAALQRKTNSELQSENSVAIMNKLVSTARELLLNVIIVLQTILQTMRNDDIRDMNDIYFCELYSNRDCNGKAVCDANAWHDCERGIETRRVFGVAAHVSLESTYLSKYVAGKTRLLTEKDESYKCYSRQMSRYDAWPEKNQDFEMLKMILQFVVLVGSTRRTHQFSGLTCAIMMLICNVHKKVEYCSQGLEYIHKIFKEIVFSRPLPYSYVLLSNVMMIFAKSPTYLRKLCVISQSMAVNNWKGSLHFTPDACPLQIFLAQVENHHFDMIAAVDIADALLQSAQYILHTHAIPLKSEAEESCNCCVKLLRFTIKTLSRCTNANLAAIKVFDLEDFPLEQRDTCNFKSICPKHLSPRAPTSTKCIRDIYLHELSDENAWAIVKRKQSKILRDGIRFLSHLAICDPDFLIRLSDIEDSFHLFMRNISGFDNFALHENEQEAMNRIKQTFISDKTQQSQMESFERSRSTRQLDLLTSFEKRPIRAAPAVAKKNEHHRFLTTIKSLYNNRMNFSNY